MSTVAGLWNQLTDAEKEGVFWAARNMIGDPGGDLILAVARHAQEHIPPPCPDPEPDPDPVAEPLICADCGQAITGEVRHRMVNVNGSQRPAWLHRICHHRTAPHREGP